MGDGKGEGGGLIVIWRGEIDCWGWTNGRSGDRWSVSDKKKKAASKLGR